MHVLVDVEVLDVLVDLATRSGAELHPSERRMIRSLKIACAELRRTRP